MTAAFGHRWTSSHGDNFAETSGRIWAIELAGLGKSEIQRGLAVAVRETWPPVLSEFKAMCMGVLPITVVQLQRAGPAAQQEPFTILVGRFISYHEWRMADPSKQERMLQQAWQQARDHVISGGDMPEYIPAAMQIAADVADEAPPPVRLTAQEAIEEIRKALRIRDAESVRQQTIKPPGSELCKRCNGTMRDPLGDSAWHPRQTRPGECLACYGSGVEASYNRRVNDDGTTEERL